MPGTSKKISELDSASSLSNSDLLEVAVVNALSDTGYSSKKTTVEEIANKVVDINPQEQADWTEADNSEPSYIKNKPTLATVATSGDYDDLTNKPTIPAAQVNSDWNSVSGVSQILNKPILATVATSGDYDDLTNKPTIPSAQVNSDWSAVSGVAQILNKPSLATVATSGDYTDLTNTPSLATVATSGSYTDLSNKPTIPDGLADLTDDVNISSPSDGQVLKYDGTSSKWINGTGGGGGASTLNDLTDVTITSATEGQVLKYDSTNSKWVNGSGGGYVEPQAQTITLLENSWTATTSPMAEGYTITVAVTGVTTISNQEILPLEVEDANDVANNNALVNAQIADAGQTTGYITLFAKNLPTDDLQIRVIVRA